MSLRLCTDLSPADWLVRSELPWDRLVTMGPAGFQAYARLRFLPDPQYAGQRESDVASDPQSSPIDQLMALVQRLAGRTTTPDDYYVCLWDGWGVSAPRPKVMLRHRAYYLLRGRLDDFGDWGVGDPGFPEPAFVWPADLAWCVTKDVDPHWAGIGGDRATIDAVIACHDLDIVRVDPGQPQPLYQG